MKPDTILETLIGKIARDEDCLNAYVKPETKLETYLDEIARSFRLAPATSPLNYGAFLVSDGTNGTKWVKPLEVQFEFSGTQTKTPYCNVTYDEILNAISNHIPLNAWFVGTDIIEHNIYYLQLTEWNRQDEEFVFSCVTVDSTEVLLYVVCKINQAGEVTIYNRSAQPK